MPGSQHRTSRKSPQQLALERRRHIVALGVLVLLVYASALIGDFVWTDRSDLLQGGQRLTSTSDLADALRLTRDGYRLRGEPAGELASSGTWQPLTILSYSISWSLWGDCAFCFHLENLLLHLLVVVGLYALGRHLLSHQRHGQRIALWGTALFAVHPATVSSVAWIGGRPYLLAALFAVWSLVLFTRLQATTKSHRRHMKRWLIGLPVCSGAAVLAHETAFVLPLAALLIAGFESKVRGRRSLGGISPYRMLALALLVCALGAVVLYRATVLGNLAPAGAYPTDSVFLNLGTAVRHFWYLLDAALLPGEPVVSDAWPISQSWGALETAALLGLLLLVGATLFGLKVGHPSAFGVAWFLVWLVPGVGILPTDHYHDSHALYMATWGIAFAIGYALFTLWRPVGRQLMPGSEAIVYVPLLLILGTVTAFSNARWWQHEALFESEIASDPHYIEGRLELARSSLEHGDATVAMNHALAAIEASRDKSFTGYWSPRDGFFLLGRAQSALGLLNEAAGSFEAALEARASDPEVLLWLGRARLALDEHKAAERHMRSALEVRREFPAAQAVLGSALVGQERFDEGCALLEAALADAGGYHGHRAAALCAIERGQLEVAAQHLEQALALREEADERARLAWVSWRLGRSDRAADDLNMALQLEEEMSPYVDWVRRQIQNDSAASAVD